MMTETEATGTPVPQDNARQESLQTCPNPLLEPWSTPFATPPFGAIAAKHFLPAFDQAFAEHAAEIAAIVNNPAAPDFANTIIALERSGRPLGRIAAVFYVVVGAHSSPELLAIETEVALRMARHWNAIMMNAELLARVVALGDGSAEALSAEEKRLLERTGKWLHRAGAGLPEAKRTRMAAINERLAALGTAFSHNLLGDEQDFVLELAEGDREGLSEGFIAAALEAGRERGLGAKAIVTLSRSSVEPFLKTSARRDLREKVYQAFVKRGDNGNARDNNAIIVETLGLREESAALLGYPSFAAWRFDDMMAGSAAAAGELLERVWKPARQRALSERAMIEARIAAEGGNFTIMPWDWRYYAEKLRLECADFDDAAITPYLSLERMIEAAFDCATRLFGLRFTERHDITAWHDDVRVFEVTGRDGRHVALFYGDYYARPSKRSGAWMTSLRDQDRLDGETTPLIVNVCNFARGAGDEPCLLAPDEARTLFHEFGHALHGILSNVTYPSLSGTAVLTDFVELPSQLYEHWMEQSEVLRRFARHHKSGEALPDALLQRFLASRRFGQGFATVEFVASALVDLGLHSTPAEDVEDVGAFEWAERQRIGVPEEIALRHRPTHFGHIFSGGAYASGYYSYMWSEVMDADAFGAFEEAGDIFAPAVARRLHDEIYSRGGAVEPQAAWLAFRGRPPAVDALLRRRGLSDDAA